MKEIQTVRFFLIAFMLVSWPSLTFMAGVQRGENESQEHRRHSTDGEEFYEQFYEWSVWSPCSRTCGTGIKFKGQLCLRENKALCEKKSRIHETCNTQACPQGSKNFRDVQCGQYNGRDIFINGERARWRSYVRGDNQCLLFCYPYGEDLFYYFGRARDGTQCSKEPHGVCVFGRCKPVGCDNNLESGIYLDKCRVCGGNSTTCQPIRGRVERSSTQFERLTGYAELMIIPKGSTSVFLTDTTWNYLALRRQNGAYIVNGNRIVNWSGIFKVGDLEVQYKRLSNNIGETIQIFGPTSEDLFVTSLLITGKLNATFEYWKPVRVGKIEEDAPEAGVSLQVNSSPLQMGWGSWTACSASCGGGIKVRARYPSIKSFREKETEVKKCNVKPCDKMDAAWSEWGLWDDCSATCGGGARIRFRYCKKQGASTRSGCPGKRYEVKLCNVETCPEEGTSSSAIGGRSTVVSSQALQTKETVTRFIGSTPVTASSPNMSSVMKTFSESSKMPRTVSTHSKTQKRPSASHLSSQSYSFQHPDMISESNSEGVRLKTFSRVEEHFSSSSTLDVIRSSELALLQSSTIQAIPSFGRDVSTATQKEISTLPSKSQEVDVLQQKISESSVIQFRSSVSRVAQSTVTSAKLLSTSSKLPGFVFSASNIRKNTVAIFPINRLSPVSTEDWFAKTRQFKSSTHSIESASSRVSGAAIPSDVVSGSTVSLYGSGKSFSDKKPVLALSSKDEAFDDSSLTPFTSPLDPRVISSLGPESSIFENSTTEASSSSLMVLSAIDYFKTSEVISSTKSRTTRLSEGTDDLRILVSSAFTTGMSKPPSTSFFAQKRTSVPSSSDIKSSTATEGRFLHFATSTSQLPSLALEEETISRPDTLKYLTSRPQVQSSRSTMNTSKLLLRTQATQITSSLSPFVNRRGYVYFTTSSYLQTSSPLKKKEMTRVSFSQRTQSVTLITETLQLSTTHLATDFKQLLSRFNILKPSIDTEGGRLFLPTETSQSVASTVEEETIIWPLHSLTSLTPKPIILSSMSTSRTSKLPFTSIFGEINSSPSLSSSVTSFVVPQARYVYLPTSSFSEFSSSGEVIMNSHRYSLSREQMFSSLTAPQASKRKERPFASLPSGQHTGIAVFPQLSSPLEGKVTTSPINSRASLPSRKHLMEESTVIIRLDLQHSSSSQFILLSPSIRPSSALKEQSTTSLLESSASLLSRQQIPSPVNSHVTSTLHTESTTGVVKLSRSSSSKHQIPSLLSPQVNSALRKEMTRSFMDSLRPSPSKQEMASLSSTQFSAASRIQIAGSIMGPATTTSSKLDIPSLSALQANLTPKEELKTGLMSSFTTSSSKLEIPPSPSPQFSSTPNGEFTKSLIDSVKTTLSQHEMQSLQPPKATFTSKAADKIGFINSSRPSSSKHEMQSLGSSHLSSRSKLQVTTSHTDSIRTSISKHEMQPLLPQKANSTPKLEVTSSLIDSMSPSLLNHGMQSLLSLKASYTSKLEVTARLIDSMRTSLSKHEMQPLLPPKASSTPKLEVTTSLIDSMRPSLSKHEMQSLLSLKASSTPKLKATASLMDLMRASLSKHEMQPLLSPKESSTSKLEVATNLVDSFIASSKHEMPSLSSLLVYSVPTVQVELSTTLTTSSSMEQMSSLSSPQATSPPKVEFTTSSLESFRTSLSKSSASLLSSSAPTVEIKISAMDLVSISSLKHKKPLLPPLQLSSGATTRILEDSMISSSSHHNPLPTIEFTTAIIGSLTASLSKQEMPSSASSRAESLPKVEFTTSLMESFRASLSKSPLPNSTPKVEIKTSVMDLFPTSSLKHETPSSSTLQLSSEVATRIQEDPLTRSSLRSHQILAVASTKSLKIFLTSSFSRQHAISSFTPHLSSTVKVEVANRLLNSSTALSSRQRSFPVAIESSISILDSLISSSPRQISSQPTSALKEASTALVHSVTSSPSGHHIVLSLSPRFNLTLKAQAMTNSVESLASSLSRQHILLSSPRPCPRLTTEAATAIMDSIINLSSRKKILSSRSSQLSPLIETEYTSGLKESLRSLSSRQPMLSSTSLLSVSTGQTLKLPRKPSASEAVSSYPIPSIFTSSTFNEEDYTFFTISTSSLFSPTPTLESPLSFLNSSSSLNARVLQERSPAVQSVSYERHFTNSLKEGESSLIWVSREERHPTVTETVDAPSIPSSAIKTQVLKMVLLSPEPASVTVVATPTPSAVQEEKSTECPPCDLSQRLKEKYCYSDYAILVRIRSEAVVTENQTSYAVKVRKVYKTNKPMKKKPEIRFDNGRCKCRTDLSMKESYLVFGKQVPWNGTIAFLELNRDSFVTEWDGTLKKEIDQLEGHCSLNSMIPTPRMSLTVTFSSDTSVHSVKKAATIALLSTRSDVQVETPWSRDWTEASTTEPSATTSAVKEKCGPCEIAIKRTRAYCTSDFVIHVKILSEAINEFNHDTNYRVRLIHTFKLTSGVTTVRSVWMLGNQCHCPLLLPGKQYLLMGQLGIRAGSSEPIGEINRQSYVEVWKASMIRRLPALKKRCPSKTTDSSTLVTETRGFTTAAVPSTTTSQLPTTQPASTPPVKCRRPCRITKKRNKSYCESDFVIRARILQSSFNDTLRERKYWVRIIKVYRSIVDLQVRENIFVVNDDCQCPKLELRKQYVIMGTVETIFITDIRLVIPPRPFVWMWKSRMEAGLQSVSCGN